MIEYKSYLQLRLICDILETHTLAKLWMSAMLTQADTLIKILDNIMKPET